MGVGNSLKMLGRLSGLADDVVEAGAKYTTKGSVMKNVTNGLSSNMTRGNMKAIQNAGSEMVDAARNGGKRAANDVVNSRTAQKALDNFNGGGTGLGNAEDVIHPEVAATYTKGGGSRGRGGNGGYNNRYNYGKGGNQKVNFNNGGKTNKADEYQRFVNKNKKKTNIGTQSDYIPAQAESTLAVDLPESSGQTNTKKRIRGAGNRYEQAAYRNTFELPNQPEFNLDTGSTGPTPRSGPTGTAQPNTDINNINSAAEPKFDFIGNDKRRRTGNQEASRLIDDDNANVQNSPWANKTQTEGPRTETNQSTQQQARTRTKRLMDPKAQEALNGVTGFAKEMFGGVTDTYKGVRNGQGIVDSFVNAHKNADGTTNMLRAAGTFMAVSSAARVASGGGLYKDRYGNPNLIGVPFI